MCASSVTHTADDFEGHELVSLQHRDGLGRDACSDRLVGHVEDDAVPFHVEASSRVQQAPDCRLGCHIADLPIGKDSKRPPGGLQSATTRQALFGAGFSTFACATNPSTVADTEAGFSASILACRVVAFETEGAGRYRENGSTKDSAR